MNKKIAMMFAAAALLGAFLRPAGAIDFKHQEDIGLETTWAICVDSTTASGPKLCGTNTSFSPSTWTVGGWLLDYSVQTVGGGAQFQVQTSTDNWDVGGNTTYDFTTSSTVWVAATVPANVDVKGQMYNTKFNLTQLDSGASVYFRIEYLLPRQKGQP